MPTLFEKVWNAHAVRTLPSGQTQLFVGLHLVHEVTSPQAFDMVRQHGETRVHVAPEGRAFLRNICMAFDARLIRKAPATQLFSSTV